MAARALPHIRYPGNVEGILYEPRAFWSVQQVDTANNPSGRLVMPRRDFLNGEPYPVTITHLTFAPLNYTFREFANGAPVDEATYHNSGAGGLQSNILIGAPQRQSYARETIRIPAWSARPRWTPDVDAFGTTPQGSSLWGATRWDFDHVMVMPEQGTLDIQLTGVTMPGGTPNDPPRFTPEFAIAVYEGPPPHTDAPGRLLWPGNARNVQEHALQYLNGAVVPPPFAPDGFGISGLVQVASQFWPPQQQLSAREYDRQNATQGGSSPVTGFAVHIDQIDYDDEVIDTDFIGALGAPAGQPITPLSLRTGIRARTRNGGTGHWWWRPGAPVALVCPSLTPAQVYKFPRPITLTPGDNLEVELQTPGPVTIGGTNINPLYQVGLAFCGYAAIEG